MSKSFYTGVAGVSRKIVKVYGGVDGIARKIRKGYVGVDGIARQFYVSEVFVFDGTYTVSRVNIDGTPHDLYTLTTGGQLYLGRNARYWMTGGGAGGSTGAHYAHSNYTSGNGGGGGYVKSGNLGGGKHTVLIGVGGTSDNAGTESAIVSDAEAISAAGGSPFGGGGSGGGGAVSAVNLNDAGYAQAPGTGGGVSTYPFGLTNLMAHSAGGGSGSAGYRATSNSTSPRLYNKGASGGSNGSDGSRGEESYSEYTSSIGSTAGGAGGSYGGGKGGSIDHRNHVGSDGEAATYYGSGGGGSGVYYYRYASYKGTGGAGYQGVVYIAIPADVAPTA